ncbi:MAG TPA: hypothetical protein VFH95_09750 [Candidatus Kapabacteria bacterium]|nr:hypothetical protein [Candidatus Kapabacteria bacterium]
MAIVVVFAFAGCSSSTPPVQSGQSSPLPTGTYNYQLNVANLRPLDTSSARYVLWFRSLGDTAWYAKPLTKWTVGVNSLDFLGTIQLPHEPDSIVSAFVSIEPSAVPANPSSILMTGAFDTVTDSAFINAANAGGAGDYSNAKASVTFTTKSPDTNQAKSEFYLMDFIQGIPISSVSNLPVPPQGWSFGLWVLDSNFYPLHQFFYGTFTNTDSSDVHPTNFDYPFPGGYYPRPLNDPGARLEITLEPDFAIQGNHPNAPSTLIVFWARLRQFIDYNDTLNLTNAWSSSAPHGILKLTK